VRLLTRLFERQRRRGWLADEDLRAVAAEARVPLYRVQELVSFYPHFRRSPPPTYDIGLCRDVACHLAGSSGCADHLRRRWQGTATS